MLRRSLMSAGLLMLVVLTAVSTSAQQPKKGGILQTFLNGDPTRLDLHSETGLQVQQATSGVYSGLLHYDPENVKEIVGDLAERWETSGGGKVVTFSLRKGVKFHDGTPFTSADVKASFDRVLNPQFRSPRCGTMVRPLVDRVEIVDEHAVRFHLKFPAATFESAVASSWCRVVAKHILERDGDLLTAKSQIGTGPFKFKRYVRDSIVEWERNPGYFKPQYPHVDGAKLFIIPDVTRALAAAKAGQLHLWTTSPALSRSQAMELKNARGDKVNIYDFPLNAIWGIIPHTKKPPFDNPDIRKALLLGLDRYELFEKNQEGIGEPCVILSPELYGEYALPLEEVRKIPGCRKPKAEDLEKARQLVVKHYPNGIDMEMIARTTGGDYVNMSQLIQAQMARFNIRARIKMMEGAAGLAAYNKGEFQMIGSQTTGMIVMDPSDVFSLVYWSKSARNWGEWSDPKVDALIDQGLREQDRKKRIKIYHDLQRHLYTVDTPGVVVGWLNGWYFTDSRLKNYHQPPTSYDNNTYMAVWLEQ